MTPFVDPPLSDSKPLPASLYHYDLFAVVTHEGKLDNGHYWADVLSGDEWWHCDDDKGELHGASEHAQVLNRSYPDSAKGRLIAEGVYAVLREAILGLCSTRVQALHKWSRRK